MNRYLWILLPAFNDEVETGPFSQAWLFYLFYGISYLFNPLNTKANLM